MLNGFEVHTAVEARLPIIWVVVVNNNGHGMVRQEEVAPTLARRVQTLANFMSLSRSSDSRSVIGG